MLLRANGYSVEEWESGSAFLDAVLCATPGCILLDMYMPGIDGPGVQRRLGPRRDSFPVIVMTGHGDIAAAIAMMKAGALDFLEKPVDKKVLIDAVDRALERLAGSMRHAAAITHARESIEALTRREREVLHCLAQGMSNKAIADDLMISARTVEIHRANMMSKLNVQSLPQALRIAFVAETGV